MTIQEAFGWFVTAFISGYCLGFSIYSWRRFYDKI